MEQLNIDQTLTSQLLNLYSTVLFRCINNNIISIIIFISYVINILHVTLFNNLLSLI